MFRGITYLVTTLSMSIVLSSCSATSINTTTLQDDGEDVKININKSLSIKDISSITVDNEELSSHEYTSSNNELILPNLTKGRHVVSFSYKNSGTVDIPVEVREGTDNTYQFNPTIENNKIGDWELGLGVSSDGEISDSEIYSKQVSNYVVINEFSGNTNYLTKEKFPQDYVNKKFNPRPKDFSDPQENIKPKAINQSPVFLQNQQPNINNQSPPPPMGTPVKVNMPLPDEYLKLKIFGVVIENKFVPDNSYTFTNGTISINSDFLRKMKSLSGSTSSNLMKVFLIDETGQGILLNINCKSPIFNATSANKTTTAPKTDLNINKNDVEYSVDKTEVLDLNKMEMLKQQSNLVNFLPKPPEPQKRRMLPIIGEQDFITKDKNSMNDSSKKYVTIDNNGEIINYSGNASNMN